MYWHDSFSKRHRGPDVDVVIVVVIVVLVIGLAGVVLWPR